MIHYRAILIVLFTSVPSAFAQFNQNLDQHPEPGNTGAYAFSFVDQTSDAAINDKVIIDMRFDAGRDNLGNVQGGMLRIKVPFSTWVQLELNHVFDFWQISQATATRYNIPTTHNVRVDGEPNFKTKVRILKEGFYMPAVSLQVSAKTAAGDFTTAHRYTDSAGYEFALLISKTLFEDPETIIRKVRLLTEVAFIAWDTNIGQQNDSQKEAFALVFETRNNLKFKASYMRFAGWQSKIEDHVSTAQFEVAKDLGTRFQVYGQGNFGLSKAATPLLIGAGLRYYIKAPQKKKKSVLH